MAMRSPTTLAQREGFARVRLDKAASDELVRLCQDELSRLIAEKIQLREAFDAHWAATKELDQALHEKLTTVRARLRNVHHILQRAQGAREERGWIDAGL